MSTIIWPLLCVVVSTLQEGEDYADGMIRVYNHPICEIIDDYNGSFITIDIAQTPSFHVDVSSSTKYGYEYPNR